MGKFILANKKFRNFKGCSFPCILVEIDAIQGLFETMDLVMVKKSHAQVPYYINFPFHNVHCHYYGHFLKECEKPFQKKVLQMAGESPVVEEVWWIPVFFGGTPQRA